MKCEHPPLSKAIQHFYEKQSKKGLLDSTVFLIKRKQLPILAVVSGTPGGIRIPNLLLRKQVLYPIELRGQRDNNLTLAIPIRQGSFSLNYDILRLR